MCVNIIARRDISRVAKVAVNVSLWRRLTMYQTAQRVGNLSQFDMPTGVCYSAFLNVSTGFVLRPHCAKGGCRRPV